MLVKNGLSLPGWRDFERAAADAFGGIASESKAIFDVVCPHPYDPNRGIGLSCKMRGELKRVGRDGRVTIEVSNSAGEFWKQLNLLGLTQANYKDHPARAGAGVIHLVEKWHEGSAKIVDLEQSSFLVLLWALPQQYQLFQYSLTMPDPETIEWSCPAPKNASRNEASRLLGTFNGGPLIEWYPGSGGQLKYFPLASDALWSSSIFTLEPLPTNIQYGTAAKAATYFPSKWNEANK